MAGWRADSSGRVQHGDGRLSLEQRQACEGDGGEPSFRRLFVGLLVSCAGKILLALNGGKTTQVSEMKHNNSLISFAISHRSASAAQSDSVRRPIRFRPPPDWVAFGVQSDGVWCTVRICGVKANF